MIPNYFWNYCTALQKKLCPIWSPYKKFSKDFYWRNLIYFAHANLIFLSLIYGLLISLLILSEFKWIKNFYSPWNYGKIYGQLWVTVGPLMLADSHLVILRILTCHTFKHRLLAYSPQQVAEIMGKSMVNCECQWDLWCWLVPTSPY